MQKKNYVSAICDVSGSQNINILAIILDKILDLKPFDKTFNPEFMTVPFLQTVKITKVISSRTVYFIEKSL